VVEVRGSEGFVDRVASTSRPQIEASLIWRISMLHPAESESESAKSQEVAVHRFPYRPHLPPGPALTTSSTRPAACNPVSQSSDSINTAVSSVKDGYQADLKLPPSPDHYHPSQLRRKVHKRIDPRRRTEDYGVLDVAPTLRKRDPNPQNASSISKPY